VDNPFVLAPMAGVTDAVFRRLALRQGCALAFTEMVKDLAVLHGNPRSLAIATVDPADGPVGVQLLGSDPQTLARAARMAEAQGAALVDLNLGCPSPRVLRNGEGAALLEHPDRVARLVEAMVAAVTVPVTVKLRRGLVPGEETAPRVARAAVAAGASAVTCHGRYASQFYSGRADWGVIGRVCEAVEVPVIGNGDVDCGPVAQDRLESTGCRGIMIGRAALGNPWLFRELLDHLKGVPVKEVSAAERLATACEHLEGLVSLHGPRWGTLAMRKHAAWYLRGIPGAAALRARLFRVDTPEAMVGLLREVLGGDGAGVHPHRREACEPGADHSRG